MFSEKHCILIAFVIAVQTDSYGLESSTTALLVSTLLILISKLAFHLLLSGYQTKMSSLILHKFCTSQSMTQQLLEFFFNSNYYHLILWAFKLRIATSLVGCEVVMLGIKSAIHYFEMFSKLLITYT